MFLEIVWPVSIVCANLINLGEAAENFSIVLTEMSEEDDTFVQSVNEFRFVM